MIILMRMGLQAALDETISYERNKSKQLNKATNKQRTHTYSSIHTTKSQQSKTPRPPWTTGAASARRRRPPAWRRARPPPRAR